MRRSHARAFLETSPEPKPQPRWHKEPSAWRAAGWVDWLSGGRAAAAHAEVPDAWAAQAVHMVAGLHLLARPSLASIARVPCAASPRKRAATAPHCTRASVPYNTDADVSAAGCWPPA